MQIKENNPELWKSELYLPSKEDNKYSRGHVLINGGKIDSAGAVKLAASAAARSLCGMVTVACTKQTLPIYAHYFTSIMNKLVGTEQEFVQFIKDRKVTSILLGPGNGVDKYLKRLVIAVLKSKVPCVIDADAISVFKNDNQELLNDLHKNCILTPHEGEFQRIFQFDGNRENSIAQVAKLTDATIILKGNETLVANKERIIINKNARPNLATAGSGDVLAGIISGLLASGMEGFSAACAGVYIHGQCGNKIGLSAVADDIIEVLPKVFEETNLQNL